MPERLRIDAMPLQQLRSRIIRQGIIKIKDDGDDILRGAHTLLQSLLAAAAGFRHPTAEHAQRHGASVCGHHNRGQNLLTLRALPRPPLLSSARFDLS